MRPRLALGLTVCAVLVTVLACGPRLSSAKSDFTSGRVPEAKEKLVALEPESRSWSDGARAEYALYRGLVHHALGDRDAAKPWLEEAQAIEARKPKTLSSDDKVRLDLALDALGR